MADKYPDITVLNSYKEELGKQVENVLTGESVSADLEKKQLDAEATLPNLVTSLISYATSVISPESENNDPNMKEVLDMCNDALKTQNVLKLHQLSSEDLLFGYDAKGNER